MASASPAVLSAASNAGSSGTPHVMVVMMENKNFSAVIGQSDQSYTNSLASQYGLATKSYAFGHPSLPNYLDLVSGSNQGVRVDEPPSSSGIFSAPTLASQLAAAGFSEKAYAENVPSPPTNDSGEYAVRHFPWVYFSGGHIPIASSSSLVSDLNSGSPPDFVWYTPNLINDEHDGSVQQGDSFLRSFIPQVQATAWYQAGGSIIVTWDESDNDNSGLNGGGGGHVPTIVVSAALKAVPQQDSTGVDTQGILHSIEDTYGLAHLGGSSADGTIDSLLAVSPRLFTNSASASEVAGKYFSLTIRAIGTPTAKLKKHGALPAGVKFHNNHDGTATISGTPNPRRAPGTRQVTIGATYGKGKTKQVIYQLFTLTITG
jgi:acid phosphatase